MSFIVRLFDFCNGRERQENFMKNEKKFLYALTKREAGAAQDACNRVTADLPENLGITNRQFDACDRAAYALARPMIDGGKILLALTPYEFEKLYLSFKCGEDKVTAIHCQTRAEMSALRRVRKKMTARLSKIVSASKRAN